MHTSTPPNESGDARDSPPVRPPVRPGSVVREPFGTTGDGRGVDLFTLRNPGGMELRVAEYGATVVSLRVPDRDGRIEDVVLGFPTLEGYLRDHPFFGGVIGRFANRIAGGRFTLDGRTYELATNDRANHLHGGEKGFDRRLWSAQPFEEEDRRSLVLTYTSPDGEEGYPGTLRAEVTYTLTDDHRFVIDYKAVTDRATPVNLTHHSYFNLSAFREPDILGHRVTLNAGRFTPIDATLIPTGEIRSVAGSPFDFREPVPIGDRIRETDEQIRNGSGFDHNFVLNPDGEGNPLSLAARVVEPTCGRVLEVYTTEPGLQFYTGNLLDGTLIGKDGVVYRRYSGFALEPQHFPDSPNQPDFPSTILRPNDEYRSRTVYRFSVQDS